MATTTPTVYYERAWAMPSGRTFTIRPIRHFIDRYRVPGGRTLDIFPYCPPNEKIKRDGLELLRATPDATIDTVLYDPVYSRRQLHELYRIAGTAYKQHPRYFKDVEIEIARVARVGARCLKFMWNSKSLQGFKVIGGLLVAHGGQHNDTICTAYERER